MTSDRAVWVIGTAEDCDFQIVDEYASGHHCRILKTDSGYVVEDLGSMNGTFVQSPGFSNKVYKSYLLKGGQSLRVGRTDLAWTEIVRRSSPRRAPAIPTIESLTRELELELARAELAAAKDSEEWDPGPMYIEYDRVRTALLRAEAIIARIRGLDSEDETVRTLVGDYGTFAEDHIQALVDERDALEHSIIDGRALTNDAFRQLRELILPALNLEDDGKTSLLSYVEQLVVEVGHTRKGREEQ